ncbi:MAG TPA: purine-nucleoside phosphorylase [Acidimicrobiales bacterium]|nr:purine-nucleoside phosphorylase [Acidimicrobiales bacterium]
MVTPHIAAQPDDFAATVLMPGDPLRARYVAEHHLEDARLVTEVRGILGYTGTFSGQRVSVMASGMGIPSISIYATELYREYGVQNIIRIGTCGGLAPDLSLRDVVVGVGASTDSNTNRMRLMGFDLAATASYEIVRAIDDSARESGTSVVMGGIFSSDLFYLPDETIMDRLAAAGILAVEMEAAGLYGIALTEKRRAAAMMTVTDNLATGERMSSEDRQTSLDSMIDLALRTAVKLGD